MEPGRRPPASGSLRLLQQFINTYNVEREHIGLPDEEFASPAGLRRWLGRHGLLPRGAHVGRVEVNRARQVREALRRLLLAHNGSAVDAAAVEVLNHTAREARLVIRVRHNGRLRMEAHAPGVAGVLGRLVAAVFTAQIDRTWQRLKACRRCHWAFYDRSRNRSGRWCVMSICGNRIKAQAYRSRHRPDRRRRTMRRARVSRSRRVAIAAVEGRLDLRGSRIARGQGREPRCSRRPSEDSLSGQSQA